MTTQTMDIRGEQLEMLPEKALWWPAASTLFVADTHFGKAATFRRAGIPVPGGTTGAMLSRLSGLVHARHAQRLVVLGDFVHSHRGQNSGYEQALRDWRSEHQQLEIALVRGNHDRGHEQLFSDMALTMLTEPYEEGVFAFCHFHTVQPDASHYALAGHIHPGVQLPGDGRNAAKIPCFWFTSRFAVLPAFGEFTGCEVIRKRPPDRVFAVGDGEVSEITALLAPRG